MQLFSLGIKMEVVQNVLLFYLPHFWPVSYQADQKGVGHDEEGGQGGLVTHGTTTITWLYSRTTWGQENHQDDRYQHDD